MTTETEQLMKQLKADVEFHKHWASVWKRVARNCRSRAHHQEEVDRGDIKILDRMLGDYRDLTSRFKTGVRDIERRCRGCISDRTAVYKYRCNGCEKWDRWADHYDREREKNYG